MAHLWLRQSGEWAVLKLDARAYDLAAKPPRPSSAAHCGRIGLIAAGGEWALLSGCGSDTRVNGLPVAANIHVLADRDEIMIRGERLYFSTESLAVVEKYAGKTLRCPRCKLEITGGEIVRCPNGKCAAAHHKDCWVYAPQCSLCPAPTPLDAGFQWTPEAL